MIMGKHKHVIIIDDESSSSSESPKKRPGTPLPSPMCINKNTFVNNINIPQTKKVEAECCSCFGALFQSWFKK